MKKQNALTRDDILHMAQLANLPVDEKEIKKYSDQLAETITYVENLNELDTSKTEETSHNTDLTNQFFEDGEKNERGLTSAEAVSNATAKQNGYFVVRRIMTGE